MAVLISHEKISVAQSPTDMRKYFEYNRCLDFTSQYPLNAQRKSTIEQITDDHQKLKKRLI